MYTVLVFVGLPARQSAVLTTMHQCSVGHEQREPSVDGISLELLLLHLAGPSRPGPTGLRGPVSAQSLWAERPGDGAVGNTLFAP